MSDLGTARRSQIRRLAETYARELPVRTVAVIGNKPLAPSAERAAAIDDCDLVVRVNGFRLDVDGEPATYGRRADVVFFTRGVRATPWFFSGYRDRLYLMIEPGRLHWEPDLIPTWWPQDLGQIHLNNDDLTVPLSAEMGLDSLRESAWATTGTMAAWWARTTFPAAQMDIAGYSFVDEPTQTSWEHAYGEACELSADHRIALEGDLMRRWVTEGKATLWH